MIVIETGFTGTAYPLTNPRIAAFPISGTVTASTEAAGFAGTNANNELTWTYWKPTAVPATWQLSFTSTAISYCAIAAHNIGTVGGTVQVQKYDGVSSYTAVASHTPTDDGPIVFLFAPVTSDRIRIRVTNAIPTIGVVWFGPILELPQKCQWTGSAPFNEALTSVYTENVSDGGHVMDRFATRKAGACAMEVQNISETWAAANIPALQAHMGALPVFMADRPSVYPKSVVYGLQQEPLQSPRARPVLGAARTLNFNIIANQPS
jgi:hypothetical protein